MDTNDKKWLSPQDLADLLDIPVGTVYKWRYQGEGPLGHTIGRHIRFSRENVEAWLESKADPPRVNRFDGVA